MARVRELVSLESSSRSFNRLHYFEPTSELTAALLPALLTLIGGNSSSSWESGSATWRSLISRAARLSSSLSIRARLFGRPPSSCASAYMVSLPWFLPFWVKDSLLESSRFWFGLGIPDSKGFSPGCTVFQWRCQLWPLSVPHMPQKCCLRLLTAEDLLI